MDGAELYAMLAEELDAEGVAAKDWDALAARAQIAWANLARRLERERRGQQMLSAYPD